MTVYPPDTLTHRTTRIPYLPELSSHPGSSLQSSCQKEAHVFLSHPGSSLHSSQKKHISVRDYAEQLVIPTICTVGQGKLEAADWSPSELLVRRVNGVELVNVPSPTYILLYILFA